MDYLSEETTSFLAGLRANNNREWFEANRTNYVRHVKSTSEAFAAILAREIGARIGAEVSSRIFRINRDLRFARDKTPYNTHVHISVSGTGGCREGGPAWMFGLEPGSLTLGAGIFAFDSARLSHWRKLLDSAEGAEARHILEELTRSGVRLSEPELKRVPAPYPTDHPCGADLRRKGLSGWIDVPEPELAFGADGPARCAERLMSLRPLVGLLDRLGQED